MDADGSRFSDDELPTEYPLALYALGYWTIHARVAQRDPSFGLDLLIYFLARRDGLAKRIHLFSKSRPTRSLGSYLYPEVFDAVESTDICPPLQFASLAGLFDVVDMLLEGGADVNVQSQVYGHALPVMISMAQSYNLPKPRLLELVQMFLDRGVHVNSQSGSRSGRESRSTTLIYLPFRSQDRVVQQKLENRAIWDAEGMLHGNALRAALSGGHHQLVEVLLEAGADIDGVFLPKVCRMGHSQVAQALLNRGADINAQDDTCGPALYEAAAEGDVQMVQLLLEKGADVNARAERDSLSALQVAAARGCNRVIEVLLANGAEATGALQMATGLGHEDAAQVLLQHGVDVNNAESEYGSALLVALVLGRDRIAKTLLDHEAEIRAEGGCAIAHSALKDTLTFGDEHIAELLFERGAQSSTRAEESDAKQLYERHRARIAEAFLPRERLIQLSGTSVSDLTPTIHLRPAFRSDNPRF